MAHYRCERDAGFGRGYKKRVMKIIKESIEIGRLHCSAFATAVACESTLPLKIAKRDIL